MNLVLRRETSATPTASNRPASARVIGVSIGLWLLALGFLCCVIAVMPVDFSPVFWQLIRLHDLTNAWAGLFVLALAYFAAPLWAHCDWERVAVEIERRLPTLCALGFGLYAALSFWAYHHHPLVMDEYAPLIEGRSFVAGQTRAWVPPELLGWIMTEDYRGQFIQVVQSRGFYSPTYWPGLAILEMPFVALGVPWLCNPLLGALALAGVHRLTKRLTGSREAAAWAWALMLASPVIAINAASFYSMSAHLLFNVVYALLLLRGDRRGALAAGVVGGFALVLHNPVPHTAFALPWLIWVAFKRRRSLAPLLLGYVVFALPLGFGWSQFLDGFDVSSYAAPAKSGGVPFAEMLGRLATVIQWPDALLILSRLAGLAKTVVWAVPGLVVLAWYGYRTLPKANADTAVDARGLRLLLASLLVTFAVYGLVKYDQGHGWGFRYLHSAWFVLAVLGGSFVARAPQTGSSRVTLRAFFAALCVGTLLILMPLRAYQVEGFLRAHLAQVPTAPTERASITFINQHTGYFVRDLIQNDPFLRDSHWRLLSHGTSANATLARQYLVNPARVQSGEWGEIWSGQSLNHPPFPPPKN